MQRTLYKMGVTLDYLGSFVENVGKKLKERCKEEGGGFYELDQFKTDAYGLQVYFSSPQMIIAKCGALLSVGVEYSFEVRKWNKKNTKYKVIYESTPYYVLPCDDLMDDESVGNCCDYFLGMLINLSNRAPEIEFLNRQSTKKG